MDTVLQNKTIACYQTVFTSTVTTEETGETVVPDKMPDIGMIAHTGASVLLRSKEAGEGKVTLEGEVQVCVLYLPDGAAGIRALHLKLPCVANFENETITRDCLPEGKIRVSSVEARMLNPRKIQVKAEIVAEVVCYEKGQTVYCVGIEDAAQSPVHLQVSQGAFSTVAAVGERTFVVTDEYPLPGAADGGEVLWGTAQFRVEDVKTIANKLILKGTVLSDVLYTAQDGSLESVHFATSFSQIMETESEDISTNARLSLMPTGMYYELGAGDGGTKLTMELHAVCQAAVLGQHEIRYVSDGFSNRWACEVEHQPMSVIAHSRSSTLRETVREPLPCRAKVAEVRFALCSAGRTTVTEEGVSLRTDVTVWVVYENGVEDCVSKRIDLQFPYDGGEKAFPIVEETRCTDIYAIAAGNNLELRMTGELDIRMEHTEILETVSSIRLDEERPCESDRPSITVVRAGGTLWEIARKYGSTEELIRQINGVEEDSVPAGSVLLVPRERF